MRDPALALLLRIAVVALVAGAIIAIRPALSAGRAARRRSALGTAPLAQWRTGKPLLLLFTGTLCSDCVRQKEVLTQLDPAAKGIAIEEIFAAGSPELARRFGVRGVPATVLLDSEGRPEAVNYGLVDAGTLGKQLEAASA